MQSYVFTLELSAEECEAIYAGTFKQLQVTSDCGKRVRFNAFKIRPFVSRLGVRGRFKITLNEQHEFVRLEQIR